MLGIGSGERGIPLVIRVIRIQHSEDIKLT